MRTLTIFHILCENEYRSASGTDAVQSDEVRMLQHPERQQRHTRMSRQRNNISLTNNNINPLTRYWTLLLITYQWCCQRVKARGQRHGLVVQGLVNWFSKILDSTRGLFLRTTKLSHILALPWSLLKVGDQRRLHQSHQAHLSHAVLKPMAHDRFLSADNIRRHRPTRNPSCDMKIRRFFCR